MRIFAFALLLGAALSWAGAAPARARQEDGADPRGLYIKSRPKKATRVAPQNSRPLVAEPASHAEPVGIGFSLYRVVDKTHSVRVSPLATFRSGDQLRFVLEPSIDGYLYIFVSTGEKSAVMIYPDPRLERGDNFVYAHTVAEVPSRRNPEFDVFRIAGGAATERVFFVVSRDPLPAVPTGDALVRYWKDAARLWSPGAAVWDDLARQSTAERGVSVREDAGTVLSSVEEQALTRDLVLGSSDSQPTVVALNESADTPTIVHMVSIRHE